MSKTVVRKNESLEDALRRFKRSVSKVELFKKYVNVNFTKTKRKRKRNLKLHVNVSSNN